MAVLDETGLIEKASQDFAPEVLSWFEALVAQDYHFDFTPQPIPVNWQKMKQLMTSQYASAFSVRQALHQLTPLKRGKDLNEYHRCFTELLYLTGETPATVGPDP